MEETLKSIKEIARYLQVNKFTIYRLAAKKKIPAFKVGGQWRFKLEMVEKWLMSHSNLTLAKRRRRR
ncbi:hypothetical protein A2661_01625 [Candidatus Giovannonibacteria bacterium RIFCSPHIGHO2_01_FULL_45_24]|uniref:Helix-turn-helix domain-containing protein n=1 Tax=Candidatus Giovannonibacteria bacterium RIFCSPLOWO2_01_FULL_46_32 TaxID=1798353 RepID=A0A1F5XHB2_9BACT|nr:MAG: hypothetical protein A2661_01625 [Candidatus Giovannonibacteria bacterium RIFCSPHIGHO2_01_FULL_45_24]OGF87267.1 MAG: hypothetical protein A3B19_03500 [Candidatus Giovannonibacteria bacterium RIFCSPLOWO2_01_FULL_46_32]